MQCKRADHLKFGKNGLIDLAQVGKIVARRAFQTLKLAQSILRVFSLFCFSFWDSAIRAPLKWALSQEYIHKNVRFVAKKK